jgi:hypothetical protein
MFVDIRFRRSGRAAGFNGDAFEKLLGRPRYRWMQSLGNSSIGTRRQARIACPAAANQLLDLVLDARDRSARVIFFCACESPWQTLFCHRHLVAQLLRRTARLRDVSVRVQEWPGDEPATRPRTLLVSAETLRMVANGTAVVPLERKRVPRNFAGIPWGTLLLLKAGRDVLPVAVGPAAYRRRQWVLPRFQERGVGAATELAALRHQSARLRRRCGLD